MKTKCVLLLTALLSACAQQQASHQSDDRVTMVLLYKPDAVYRIETRTRSSMEMNLARDEAGVPATLPDMPVQMGARQEMVQKIETGTPGHDGAYSVDQHIFKQRSYVTVNGAAEKEQPIGNVKLEGMHIKGRVLADGSMEYVSAEGAGVSPQVEQVLRTLFGQLTRANELEGKAMGVGETTSVKMPMSMPNLAGVNVNVNAETTYTLKEIKNDNAYFDIGFVISVDAASTGQNIRSTGSGTGSMTYDVKNGYTPLMNLDMVMDLEMPGKEGGVVKNHSVVNSEIMTSYEPNK